MNERQPDPAALGDLVARARGGERRALDALVRELQGPIYNMAVRMLWHPADAEDACQDILVRIVTNLAQFRGESSVRTWAYRIAANVLLTARGKRRPPDMTFDEFAGELESGRAMAESLPPAPEAERAVLIEEVKLGCMTGMLLCLDPDHRLAYILGDIFELPGDEAATVLDVAPSAFRKRLSRARERLHAFLQRTCGVANPDASCRCEKMLPAARHRGRVDGENLLFADRDRVADGVTALESMRDAAQLYRSHPQYEPGEDAASFLRALLNDERLAFLRVDG